MKETLLTNGGITKIHSFYIYSFSHEKKLKVKVFYKKCLTIS